MILPAHLMVGTTVELQCPAGHRSWLPLEDLHLVCVCCGSCAARTGRTKLSARAGVELCGVGTSPRLRTILEKAAEVEIYKLHLDVPALGKFSLD